MTETQARFLRAVAGQVPLDRVAEVHLFPSMKQAGVETGIAVVAAEAEEARHTVYSARYRLTLKGSDRGKWECDVVAEADAPLITVEAVVRGVRHRSDEQGEPELVSGDALRQLALEPAR
jgi:hypothetical protein